jgi:hypothetical protein
MKQIILLLTISFLTKSFASVAITKNDKVYYIVKSSNDNKRHKVMELPAKVGKATTIIDSDSIVWLYKEEGRPSFLRIAKAFLAEIKAGKGFKLKGGVTVEEGERQMAKLMIRKLEIVNMLAKKGLVHEPEHKNSFLAIAKETSAASDKVKKFLGGLPERVTHTRSMETYLKELLKKHRDAEWILHCISKAETRFKSHRNSGLVAQTKSKLRKQLEVAKEAKKELGDIPDRINRVLNYHKDWKHSSAERSWKRGALVVKFKSPKKWKVEKTIHYENKALVLVTVDSKKYKFFMEFQDWRDIDGTYRGWKVCDISSYGSK